MNSLQAPSAIVMVRPQNFQSNPSTVDSNTFQQQDANPDLPGIRLKAREEFDRMVALLESNDIETLVWEDISEPVMPDAIFPNNWFSTHPGGEVFLYPMLAQNRRTERRPDLLKQLTQQFHISRTIDLSVFENRDQFLEGTGSIVFDYINKIAYASRSPRTDEELLRQVCVELGYKPIVFDAVNERGVPIYHTNVLLCVGTKFAVLCLDAIRSDDDQEVLLETFASTGHKVVAISYDQLNAFAGNMIELKTKSGEPVVVLSETAFNSLLPGQIDAISRHAEMIPVDVSTIQAYGGGSVRCMIAGIYLPKLTKLES